MKVTIRSRLVVALLAVSMTSCASFSGPIAIEATAETYAKTARKKGLVVVAVNWGRRWGCGSYQNAGITSFGFDLAPLETASNDKKPNFFLKGPSIRSNKQEFANYAYLMEPGEYALSSFEIEAAYSPSDVDRFITRRSDLIQNGKAIGGSFDVQAGEIVYIGHFFINCGKTPMLWRYYTEDKSAFDFHMIFVKKKYPFLDVRNAKYRLFRTKNLGRDHKFRR